MNTTNNPENASLPDREPTLTVGALSAAVAALIGLLTAFGLDLDPEQTAAILGFVAVVAPLAAALIARRKTTANVRVVEKAKDGDVVAGPANDISTGQVIRPL